MKTRHCGICIVGYYEKLKTLSTADLYEEKREKKKELTLRSKGQKSFANSVNKFIIKALKRNYKTEKENRWAKEYTNLEGPLNIYRFFRLFRRNDGCADCIENFFI